MFACAISLADGPRSAARAAAFSCAAGSSAAAARRRSRAALSMLDMSISGGARVIAVGDGGGAERVGAALGCGRATGLGRVAVLGATRVFCGGGGFATSGLGLGGLGTNVTS